MIPGHMQKTCAVEHDADNIMCVFCISFVPCSGDLPIVPIQFSSSQYDVAVRIIIGCKLKRIVAYQLILTEYGGVHRVLRPAQSNVPYNGSHRTLCHKGSKK